MRADQVEAAWNILTPILNFWDENKPCDFPNYAAGSWDQKLQKKCYWVTVIDGLSAISLRA